MEFGILKVVVGAPEAPPEALTTAPKMGCETNFAKWGSLCCEMALVCQKLVSQLQNTLRNGALVAKLGIFMFWSFAVVS